MLPRNSHLNCVSFLYEKHVKNQGCTNPGSSIWNLLHVTLPASEILRWFLEFGKFVTIFNRHELGLNRPVLACKICEPLNMYTCK